MCTLSVDNHHMLTYYLKMYISAMIKQNMHPMVEDAQLNDKKWVMLDSRMEVLDCDS